MQAEVVPTFCGAPGFRSLQALGRTGTNPSGMAGDSNPIATMWGKSAGRSSRMRCFPFDRLKVADFSCLAPLVFHDPVVVRQTSPAGLPSSRRETGRGLPAAYWMSNWQVPSAGQSMSYSTKMGELPPKATIGLVSAQPSVNTRTLPRSIAQEGITKDPAKAELPTAVRITSAMRILMNVRLLDACSQAVITVRVGNFTGSGEWYVLI